MRISYIPIAIPIHMQFNPYFQWLNPCHRISVVIPSQLPLNHHFHSFHPFFHFPKLPRHRPRLKCWLPRELLVSARQQPTGARDLENVFLFMGSWIFFFPWGKSMKMYETL